jgi:hypothetical protein
LKEAQHAFAVVRLELSDDPRTEPELAINIKVILFDEEHARGEVARLNALAEGKRCLYFYQVTRYFPHQVPQTE